MRIQKSGHFRCPLFSFSNFPNLHGCMTLNTSSSEVAPSRAWRVPSMSRVYHAALDSCLFEFEVNRFGYFFAVFPLLCYNQAMQNWSVDTTELQKDPEQYALWRLEHLVNFGLGGERIDQKELRKYWGKMNLDPNKKNYLTMLLWPKQS